MKFMKNLGSRLMAESENLVNKMKEIPLDDLESFQAYIQQKDHPQLYLEDKRLELAMKDLESSLQALDGLEKGIQAYKDALLESCKTTKELGEQISVTGITPSYESHVPETTISLQIHLGACYVIESDETAKYANNVSQSLKTMKRSVDARYHEILIPNKKKYEKMKIHYIKVKKELTTLDIKPKPQSSTPGSSSSNLETPNTPTGPTPEVQAILDKRRELAEAKLEWETLSEIIMKDASELTEEAVRGVAAFLTDYSQWRQSYLDQIEKTFAIKK